MTAPKAILLYSGGLDSVLAGKLLQQQGVDVLGLYCILPFVPRDMQLETLPAVQLARRVGIDLEFYRCGDEYLAMLRNPPHGYGKHMNPCIDCKIFFLKQASALMREKNADFVATGEVAGQRPMSQQKNMLVHIERESGLSGRLLRPLSAKLLKPTIPEEEGLVNRENLLAISGRGRKVQMAMADTMGIAGYSSPAGGCLFTDGNYARRLGDLFSLGLPVTPEHLYVLTLGRYFRVGEKIRIIISRNEREGNELLKYDHLADRFFDPDFKGPVGLVIGDVDDDSINTIGGIISSYGSPLENDNRIRIRDRNGGESFICRCDPIDDGTLKSLRL